MLIDLVSDETGASTKAVRKILNIFLELQMDDAELYLRDGEIVVDWISNVCFDGEPEELWIDTVLFRRIEALDDFDGELIEPIKPGWLKVYGAEYPTTAIYSPGRFAEVLG